MSTKNKAWRNLAWPSRRQFLVAIHQNNGYLGFLFEAKEDKRMTVGRRGKFNFDLLPGSRKKSEKTWHAAEGLVTLFSIEKNLRTLTSLDTVCPVSGDNRTS